MGVESKKAPPLPAPTESESLTPTDLGTDVSRPVDDKSSYSLPDDGSPVTIKTRGHKPNRSQTSLLIEYFEGSRSPDPTDVTSSTARRPSVRVRLTPSSKGRGKNDHIQITETRSTRGSTVSRRVTASRSELEDMDEPEDTRSMNSYASATEESNVSRNPIEVEITPSQHGRRRDRKASSPLIPAADSKVSSYIAPGNMSDISVIPSDSFLDGDSKDTSLPREENHARSSSRGGESLAAGALGAVASATVAEKMNRKPRSESHDRKVIERAVEKATKPERRRKSSKSRTSDIVERESDIKSSARRRSKGHKESAVSAAESSLLSSQLSPSHRSYDSHSSSKVSINNPKLLETVEDAIRRLILPELNAIKREQSQRESRKPKDRESISSIGSASREELSLANKRKSADTTQSTKSRGREARNDLSPRSSIDQDSVVESSQDENVVSFQSPRQSEDRLVDPGLLGAAAAGGVAMSPENRSSADERRQRRRRRAKTPERGRASRDLDVDHEITPPMPLSSEINPSELTRTSIRSAETDRPHSATEETKPVQEVIRGVALRDSVSETPTPTRTPAQTLQTLGALHANVSHGDLKALPRQGPGSGNYEPEFAEGDLSQRFQEEYDEDYDETGQLAEPGMYESEMDSGFYGSQDVPPPLRYVPYQQERRGLSPIESVSGYTESEVQHRRDSRVSTELSPADGSPSRERDVHTPNSVPSNLRGRGFDDEESSVRSSGHYRDTRYTDDSELGRVVSGQAVRDIGANPEIIHPPLGAESAVASLVDGSLLTPSALTPSQLSAGQDYRDSQMSGHASPAKGTAERRREIASEHGQSPAPLKDTGSDYSEYEIDEYGRKVPRTKYRQSPTASEQATINAALGRAVALKAKNEVQRAQVADEQPQGEGVSRNRSFKERAKNGYQINTTPRHSIDRLSDYGQPRMGASGLPDVDHPMPEIGYGYEESQTPSVIQEPLGGADHDTEEHWQEEATPTQEKTFDFDRAITPQAKKGDAHGPGISATEAAVAGALATAGAMTASHNRHPSGEQEDEWQRTSAERKRDTLVTNPYEGASPIANLPGVDGDMLGGTGYGADPYRAGYNTGSPGIAQGDEGYISAAPNEIRDVNAKGKGVDFIDNSEDPFYSMQKDTRHLSGLSNGLGSPLYDAATGAGIDRIQSKDIIALMEHVSKLSDQVYLISANCGTAYGARCSTKRPRYGDARDARQICC
jgi:hypothetical protein